MSAADNVKPHLTPEGKFALLMIAGEIPVFIAFVWLGKASLGLGACICLAVVAIAVRATWVLNRQIWYWLAVAISLAMQIPLLLDFPWSNRAYRPLMLPIAICDFVVAWGCIKGTEKLFARKLG